MQDTVEIDILELLGLLWKNIIWIILCSTVGFTVAFLLSRYMIPPKYTSSVSLYVNNATDVTSSAVNINDINASQKLVNTYIVILQDDEVLDAVGERLMEKCTISQLANEFPVGNILNGGEPDFKGLKSKVKMSSVNNTEVLNIEVTTKNADLSALICNIITEIAPDELTRVVKAGSVEVIGSAKPADKPSSPNVPLNSMVGLLAGLALSVGGILLIAALDNTIGTEEEFKKRYNIPILGEVPDFAMNLKGAYKRYGGQNHEAQDSKASEEDRAD